MKKQLPSHRFIQPSKTFSFHEMPHEVFLTRIVADPYSGCDYSCPYCYAVKDETQPCAVKTNLAGRLKEKLGEISEKVKIAAARPSIMIGGMTDPYQPVEKEMMVTRRCLEVISVCEFPLQIFTKSELVLRDSEILREHSAKGMAAVNITIFSLEEAVWRAFEGNTPHPLSRFETIHRLVKKDILCGVILMPIFPFINDAPDRLEAVFRAAKKSGAEYLIPGRYKPEPNRSWRKVLAIIKEKFGGVSDKFFSLYGHSGGKYEETLIKKLETLSEKYKIPLSVPVPGTRGMNRLDFEPVS